MPPPRISAKVKLLQAVGDGEEEVRYITNTHVLTLWIDALDPVCGSDSYGFAWGLWDELEGITLISSETSVIELTDFIMPDEEKAIVFFRGTCQNPAGLTADGYSAGVMLETGAPIITGVRGIFSHDMFLDWEVDLSRLFHRWTVKWRWSVRKTLILHRQGGDGRRLWNAGMSGGYRRFQKAGIIL